MRGTTYWPHGRGSARYISLRSLALLMCAAIPPAFLTSCASVSAGDDPLASTVSVIPAAVNFKELVVGQKNSQTIRVTNTGKEPVSLQSLHVSGQGFALSPAKTPHLLLPGKNLQLTVTFSPAKAVPAAGTLTISGSDLKGLISVPLSGSGERAVPQLQVFPGSLNFGSVAVNSSATQTVMVKNTGNVRLSLTSLVLSNSLFSINGFSAGVSLAPNQTSEFKVSFHPTKTGTSTATLSLNGTGLASPAKLTVSGSATSTASPTSSSTHLVRLTWGSSPSSAAGYHVYRGGASGGPYNRISGSVIAALDYTDTSVQAGHRYYYVVTALNSEGAESSFSNEAGVDVPNP